MSKSSNIGVEYKPSSVDLGILQPDYLEDLGINFVRLQWVDLTNTIRFRILSVSYFRKLLESERGGVNVAIVMLALVGLSVAEGFPTMGEYIYTPDIRTLRRCPFESGHASCMGWFEEKAPKMSPDGSSSVAVSICPRTTLKRVVDRAEIESNVKFLVGFESEFVLLKSISPVEVVGTHAVSTSESLRSGDIATNVMHEIAKSIQDSGIELQIYHGEGAPGQYEVVTGPLPPLESADALIHTREIIYNTAALYGLRATFTPRISMSSIGTAAHAHISIHSTLPGATKDASTLSASEKSFLAGLMAHLPALPALTLPTTASYRRVGDGVWSGGTYVCWGTENREAPIRLTNPSSATSRNFELRFVDGTANPYLALAGIIGAGHAGIREQMEFTVQDNPGPKTAAEMSEDERHALGIVSRMPLSWEEGRRNIQNNPELVSILGNDLLEKYLSVNKLLDSTLNDPAASEDERLRATIGFY